MRAIIQYIRSLFCDHEFEYYDDGATYWSEDDMLPIPFEVSWCCKKCGEIIRKKWS
jgi:hypothetical protein